MKVYTTEFINYLSLIIATKVKNNLIRLNLHQNYSFRQIIEYLRSYKVEVINNTEWKNASVEICSRPCGIVRNIALH
nr:hypothetical protein [Mycoplasmopsis bovis]